MNERNGNKNFSNYTHILWDFNGTILDDVETGILSANALLRRRNMNTIRDVKQYHSVFCFPIIQYYTNLGFDFTKERFEDLAVEWMELYLDFSRDAKLHDGAEEVFTVLKQRNIHQIILSATEKNMLEKQLEELGILPYFDEILGLDNIHANSKVDIAKDWIGRVCPERALIIGDTLHDYEVAGKTGVDCVLIANGHQARETLMTCGVPVYRDIRELMDNLIG